MKEKAIEREKEEHRQRKQRREEEEKEKDEKEHRLVVEEGISRLVDQMMFTTERLDDVYRILSTMTTCSTCSTKAGDTRRNERSKSI